MRGAVRATLGAVALVALAGGLGATPALADCGGDAYFRGIERVDIAFIGTFAGIRKEPVLGRVDPFYYWSVERSLQGSVPRGTFRFDGVSCHPAKFAVGQRYLVAYDDFQNIDAWRILAYRIVSEDDLRLVAFERPRSAYAAEFRVTTLSAALSLLGLPETSAAESMPPADRGIPLALGAVFLIGILAAALLGRRRSEVEAGP